jgi:2-polyprenyl-3-methyl-5-hydroxy-6-metoxy-1,4-benzoquinol methylase
VLAANRFNRYRELGPDQFVRDACPGCGDQVLALKHFGSHAGEETRQQESTAAAYRCTSIAQRSYPPVYTCLHCGLQQVPSSAIPRDLEQLYEEVVDQQYLSNIAARERTFARLFDQIASSLPALPGRMLEVGAYCGLFAREATKHGWQVDGVEPSAWAAKYARETVGVNVHPGFLADNRSRLSRQYDAAVSWDVLEHVRDPLAFARECGDYLPPGGVLCFSTLDVDTWFPRLMQLRWPWLMDMHLYYFDRHVVKELLSRAGFDLIRAETYVHYAFVKYALRSGVRSLPRPVGKLADKLIALIPTRAIVPIGFGDVKVYIARKREPMSGAIGDVLATYQA